LDLWGDFQEPTTVDAPDGNLYELASRLRDAR
jgi:hypothetical protein